MTTMTIPSWMKMTRMIKKIALSNYISWVWGILPSKTFEATCLDMTLSHTSILLSCNGKSGRCVDGTFRCHVRCTGGYQEKVSCMWWTTLCHRKSWSQIWVEFLHHLVDTTWGYTCMYISIRFNLLVHVLAMIDLCKLLFDSNFIHFNLKENHRTFFQKKHH